MIVCTRCGHQAREGEAFCAGCGAFLEWTSAPATPEAPATSAEAPAPVKPAAPHPVSGPAAVTGAPLIVSVSAGRVQADPGGEAVVEIQVSNRGRTVDRLSLEVLGPAAAWWSVDPATLNLMPGTSGGARLRCRPPRSPEAPAGEHTVQLVVRSGEHPDDAVAETVLVDVAPFVEIELTLAPSVLHGSTVATTSLRATNAGNTPVELLLSGEDPETALDFEIAPLRLRVEGGGRVEAGVTVRPREAIQSGPERTRPFRIVATMSDGARRTLDGTFVQAAVPRAPLLVTLGASTVRVEPGDEASVRVDLANRGSSPDQLAIGLRGPAAAWATVEPAPQLSLLPETSTTAIIHFRPPRRSTTSPGGSVVEVDVWSREHPEASVAQRVNVEVLPYVELVPSLAPSVMRGRRDARARLAVVNGGNAPVELSLTATDPEMALEFRISPTRLVLNPGATAEASVAVRARKSNPLPTEVSRPIRVVLASRDGSPSAVDGTFVQEAARPRRGFPRWVVLIGLLTAAAAAAVAFLPDIIDPFSDSTGSSNAPPTTPVIGTERPYVTPEAVTPAPPTPTEITPAPPPAPAAWWRGVYDTEAANLGKPAPADGITNEGIKYREFDQGAIYALPGGPFAISGHVWMKWKELGGGQQASPDLGYPTSGRLGRGLAVERQVFERGAIYLSPDTGAHAVYGPIWIRWRELLDELNVDVYDPGSIALVYGYPKGDIQTNDQGITYIELTEGTIGICPGASQPYDCPTGTLCPCISLLELFHTVQPGDSLSKIAMEHGVTVEDILAWNPGLDRAIPPLVGTRLRIQPAP